jgi:transcription antitermination protein NusB
MGARTAAREAALQMLYAAELGQHSIETLIKDFWREFPGDAEGRSYADEAVRGVLADRPKLDEQLISASANWRLERMSPVARNVLRLGTWELLTRLEIPRAVIIDESVEVAKRYGGTESGSFVNGVLDRIADACGRVNEPRKGAPRAVAAPEVSAEDATGGTEEDQAVGGGAAAAGAAELVGQAFDDDDDDDAFTKDDD